MQALFFIGIPGAGKSTFGRTRFFDSHLRLNFDQLKTRHREAILVRACLESKTPFLWDNTNPTRAVRAPLMEQLKVARFEAIAFYFEPDFDASWQRNQRRSGKSRVSLVGMKSVAAQLAKPTFDEGFAAIFSVWNQNDGAFRVEEWPREI